MVEIAVGVTSLPVLQLANAADDTGREQRITPVKDRRVSASGDVRIVSKP